MNLVLAKACSNSCPYFFETAERHDRKHNLISAENTVKLAAWARDSGLETLSLLGDEPFLHPGLADSVSLFRQVCPNTRLRILTGGIFQKRLLDNLSPDDVGLVFNINEPRDYRNPKHYDKVIRNVETAIRRGFHVVLGFNVSCRALTPASYRIWLTASPSPASAGRWPTPHVVFPPQCSPLTNSV